MSRTFTRKHGSPRSDQQHILKWCGVCVLNTVSSIITIVFFDLTGRFIFLDENIILAVSQIHQHLFPYIPACLATLVIFGGFVDGIYGWMDQINATKACLELEEKF